MATYTPIEHGKPNWDKDLNDNIAKIFGGGVGLSDTGWSDSATLLNNAQIYSTLIGDSDPRRTAIRTRVLKYGSTKLVLINGIVGFKTQDDIVKGVPIIQLTEGNGCYFSSGIRMAESGIANSLFQLSLNQNGTQVKIDDYSLNSIPEGDVIWFPINLMYIS